MLSAFESTLSEAESELSTYRHMKMAVPSVLANATPREQLDLRSTAPRLLGLIQARVSEPRFVATMAPLYGGAGA